MKTPGTMTALDFDDALQAVRRGEAPTTSGAWDELEAALDAVARSLPGTGARIEAVRAAKVVFHGGNPPV